ncbi:MAG: thermonuclease family protein [Chitinophagaceae bacterium]
MKLMVFWFFSVFNHLLISCEPAQKIPAEDIHLTVYKIIDGDSFEGRANGQNYRIRLFGIDAPEKGQDFYQKSKDRLGQLCKEGPIIIKIRNKDYFGRWVADGYTQKGECINQTMVKEGFAWHFTKYSKDATLKKLERDARDAQIGIWSLKNPTAPWEYRKSKKSN